MNGTTRMSYGVWEKRKKKRLGRDFNDKTGSHKNGNWAWNY